MRENVLSSLAKTLRGLTSAPSAKRGRLRRARTARCLLRIRDHARVAQSIRLAALSGDRMKSSDRQAALNTSSQLAAVGVYCAPGVIVCLARQSSIARTRAISQPHRLFGRIPSGETNSTPSRFGSGVENATWWVKFSIDLKHPLAWNVVQELGYVLNSLSVQEKLPTTFKPVSPPPYLNGGTHEYLSWLIECPADAMTPGTVTDWLEGRLPRPVDDRSQWGTDN